jgi:DUF4097 and DUF4098 domain-containing protein YvlB
MANSFQIDIPGHAELHVTARSGQVLVIAEDRSDVFAESGASSRGPQTDATGRISIASARAGTANLILHCPTGTDITIGTISGNIELRGGYGQVRITTIGGSIRVERADEVDARTVSGSIEVERASGRCLLRTKSGRAVCGSVRDARVSTVSGTIQLDETQGKVRAQSVSGTVEVGTDRDGDVAVQTISGSVRVEVPHGLRPAARLHSLSSRPRCDCPEGDDVNIAVRSVSGKIEVLPSA